MRVEPPPCDDPARDRARHGGVHRLSRRRVARPASEGARTDARRALALSETAHAAEVARAPAAQDDQSARADAAAEDDAAQRVAAGAERRALERRRLVLHPPRTSKVKPSASSTERRGRVALAIAAPRRP